MNNKYFFQLCSIGASRLKSSAEQLTTVILLVRNPTLFLVLFFSNNDITVSTEQLHCANTSFFGLVHHLQKKPCIVTLEIFCIYRTIKWEHIKESANQVRLYVWQWNYTKERLIYTTLRLSESRNWLLSLVQCVRSINIVGDATQSGGSCWILTSTLSARRCSKTPGGKKSHRAVQGSRQLGL